jgi:hypothetical protein
VAELLFRFDSAHANTIRRQVPIRVIDSAHAEANSRAPVYTAIGT